MNNETHIYFAFGKWYACEHGIGRKISYTEALRLLDEGATLNEDSLPALREAKRKSADTCGVYA